MDGGFATREDITALERRGITVYAPTRSPRTTSGRTRAEPRPDDTPEVAAWRRRMETDEAQAVYKERAATAEWKDGKLTVGYEQYTEFGRKFGHIFHQGTFSHYVIAVEYRFVGEQVAGGPGWALRNSGIMVHGQPADTMTKDQDFPISIEVQLLGGIGLRGKPVVHEDPDVLPAQPTAKGLEARHGQ